MWGPSTQELFGHLAAPKPVEVAEDGDGARVLYAIGFWPLSEHCNFCPHEVAWQATFHSPLKEKGQVN
jgi:hypothetical protein